MASSSLDISVVEHKDISAHHSNWDRWICAYRSVPSIRANRYDFGDVFHGHLLRPIFNVAARRCDGSSIDVE